MLAQVPDLAHHFFSRCLKAEVVPYVVTKKTVFKWQEGFWVRMKEVFDENYRQDYLDAGLLDGCGEGLLLAVSRVGSRAGSSYWCRWSRCAGGELQHLISDAATMQVRARCLSPFRQRGSTGCLRPFCACADYPLDRRWVWHGGAQLRRRYAHRCERASHSISAVCQCPALSSLSAVWLARR